ncbi:P-loop ATPase, Sll1717 family [Lentzea sp. NPDC058436]|uniref:P-loop ATPase, Sll1717 family n=1 Tax=Lentzea sp. NPDC058436 TaxID=3346499 RepID=UPI00364BC4FB
MDQTEDRHQVLPDQHGLKRVLTAHLPFGPIETEKVITHGRSNAEQLFDRNNRVYAQAAADSPPTYIIGRKGAGKTAFLIGSDEGRQRPRIVLQTEDVYHEMLKVFHEYGRDHELFVGQRAALWQALFEHVALVHVYRTFDSADPQDSLHVLTSYLGNAGDSDPDESEAATRFLRQLRKNISESPEVGFRDAVDDLTLGRTPFSDARTVLRAVLARRQRPPVIVMDNLEELHLRLRELRPVLAGLFRCVGGMISSHPDGRPFGVQVCLPSELWDRIHDVAAAPEKDLQGRYLTIYWTARELLRLSGTRLQLFLHAHHPDKLEALQRRADQNDESDPSIALLRAALPPTIHSGLDIDEDPLAYLLRHTQLLPRHLIQILNSVFSRRDRGSTPWNVTPAAVIAGTRHAERLLVHGILSAYKETFPEAADALHRLTGRLEISFPARTLHKVYNQQGIKKLTRLDFDELLSMLFTLGALGIRFGQTGRYNKAHFQYTFDYPLVSQEESDHLCLHPLFTRYLLERTLPQLRARQAHATYPYGSDPKGEDYRDTFGYLDS